jgi:hypothetical protein
MKQYRVTSADFNSQHSHIPDAFIPDDDLAQIKHLAGLGKGLLEDYMGGISNVEQHVPSDQTMPSMSPVGSNISITGMEKQRLEKELHIVPGSPEWFRLWFSRPYLTGEKPIGDAPPDSERNPRYLLDKNGQPDQDKVEKFSTDMNRKNRNSLGH